MQTQNYPDKNTEIGFIRKRDGKIINVKLIDVLKKLNSVDFLNNEVSIKGETLIADSFRKPFYEVTLNIVKNTEDGNGAVTVNGAALSDTGAYKFEKGSVVVIGVTPDENSVLDNITDSTGQIYELTDGQLSITLTDNTSLTISFKAKGGE